MSYVKCPNCNELAREVRAFTRSEGGVSEADRVFLNSLGDQPIHAEHRRRIDKLFARLDLIEKKQLTTVCEDHNNLRNMLQKTRDQNVKLREAWNEVAAERDKLRDEVYRQKQFSREIASTAAEARATVYKRLEEAENKLEAAEKECKFQRERADEGWAVVAHRTEELKNLEAGQIHQWKVNMDTRSGCSSSIGFQVRSKDEGAHWFFLAPEVLTVEHLTSLGHALHEYVRQVLKGDPIRAYDIVVAENALLRSENEKLRAERLSNGRLRDLLQAIFQLWCDADAKSIQLSERLVKRIKEELR